jgi:uncharacterized membrane protein YphA (DoxX/SURF4 family)
MLASVFVVGGIEALRNPAPRAKAAESIAPLLTRLVPQLPSDTVTLVRLSGATQVAGGVALGAGFLPRLSAAALAATLIPQTLAGHRFWEEHDEETRRNQRQHFLKGVGLLGGLLLAAVDTDGQPGLAWRARRAGDDLQHSTRRMTRRAKREAKLATRAAKQEARILRAETKARIAA